MAAIYDSTSSSSTFCSHCERDIPSSNFALHSAHCQRNLERCNECREMVPRVRAKEHYNEYHAPATCSLCEAQISRDLMATHKAEKCPRREMECYFCQLPVEASNLTAHTDFCGSRTEMCIPCGKYVRLREKSSHDLQFHPEGDDSDRVARCCYFDWIVCPSTAWFKPVNATVGATLYSILKTFKRQGSFYHHKIVLMRRALRIFQKAGVSPVLIL